MTTIVAEVLAEDGAPQVGVTVTDLDAGDQIISVQVSWDSQETWRTVSGGDRVVAVGGAFVRDHFTPLNVEAVWRVIEHSVSGEPATVSDALVVPSEDIWLQDALDPRSAVTLVATGFDDEGRGLMFGSFAHAAWSQPVDIAQVLGDDRPVASVGQRMIAGQVPLVIEHKVAAEGGALRRLLMRSGQMVLRGHDFDVLEPVAFIVAAGADETRELRVGNPAYQVSTWDLTVSQVRPLSLKFVVPWWTYDQVKAMYAGMSYDDVKASKPGASYLDWKKDPTP